MSRAWMPFYVADYLADTGHLSTVEHGAYLLLIMHYWQTGGLPTEPMKLARIARMSPEEWASIATVLLELFSDGWRHKRIDAELAKATAKYEKRAEAGKKGGNAKAEASNARFLLENPASNALAKPCQSQSQSHIKKEDTTQTASESVFFEELWKAYPRREGDNPKKPARASFHRALRHGADPPAIIAAVLALAAKHPIPTPYVPQTATWLNQERWKDEESTGPPENIVRFRTVEEIYAEVQAEKNATENQGSAGISGLESRPDLRGSL